jgi:uncharacterized protein HemX
MQRLFLTRARTVPHLFQVGPTVTRYFTMHNEPQPSSSMYSENMQKRSRNKRNVIYISTLVLIGASLYYVYKVSQDRVISQLQRREYGTQQNEGDQHKQKLENAAPTLRDHIAVSKRRIVEIEICHGDITNEPTDAIVNAGNHTRSI